MKIRFLSFLLATFMLSSLFGQDAKLDLSKPIPVDPKVRTGKLDNGLRYYIRQNKKPEKRVELRLAVNTGSIMETDLQQGLAHFTEHMCFNGTTHFPKNELVNFLQTIGVRFGADINAYTSFDETVYMLQIPTDKEGLLEKGYQVIEDWAHNVTFDGKEIDKERGVITEEWRLGLGANDRMRKKYFPIIFKGSKYADRIPIGTYENLQNFKHEVLREFYHDWYRPDLQAVIIVGDVNLDSAEAKIRQHFGGIKGPENPKTRVAFDLPSNKEPLIAITTDKEATGNMAMIFYKHPHSVKKLIGDYKEYLMEELYTGMLNARLSELALKPDAVFIGASTSYGQFLARSGDAYSCYVAAKENQIDKSLELILTENERVKKYGFLESEFERQKEEILSRMEKSAKEADKTESANFCSEYADNFLSDEPIPGIKNELKFTKKLLPEILLSDINALAKKWVSDDNIALVITAPEKEGVKVPTQEQVLTIIKDTRNKQIEPYVDNFKTEPLLSEDLKGSKIINKKENKDLNFTELTLANGVKVVLKSTDFKNDEILVTASSPGGHSLYPDKDFISANFSSQIIDQSGIGNFDNVQLEKKLKGKVVQISPYISDIKEGFTGSSTPKDFETLLQLTYLYFKAPRKDTSAFRTFASQMKNQLKFVKANPQFAFYDTLYKSSYPGAKRLIILPTEQQINQIELDKVYQIYQDRFADASDFTFVFVGNFDIDSITPMIEKYLGSLPSTKRKETWKDVSPEFAKGITEVSFHKGTEKQGMVGLLMSGNLEWNDKNKLCIGLLQEIMDIKLVEVIREKMSGVYSPQASMSLEHYPKTEYNLMVMFGCAPKSADKLTKAVFGIMKDILKKGPTQIDFDKAKETLIRSRETNIKKNNYWLNKLESAYFDGDDINQVLTFEQRIKAITIDDLKQLAQKCFTKDHYVRVVLMPEETK
ncbi:MAG: insulinase family protein [Bacteroidetes bacterium]|nr:insulinase family protein [Bacteroidota bacterium]